MKKWTCICGSTRFSRTRQETTIVDFSREGAIEGHPLLEQIAPGNALIQCTQCGSYPPNEVQKEMLKEIV